MLDFIISCYNLGKALKLGNSLRQTDDAYLEISLGDRASDCRYDFMPKKQPKSVFLPRIPQRTSTAGSVRIIPGVDDIAHLIGIKKKKKPDMRNKTDVYEHYSDATTRHDEILRDLASKYAKQPIGKAAEKLRIFLEANREEIWQKAAASKLHIGRVICSYKGQPFDHLEGFEEYYESLMTEYMGERTFSTGICILTNKESELPDAINVRTGQICSSKGKAFHTFGKKISSMNIGKQAWNVIHDCLDVLEEKSRKLSFRNNETVLCLFPLDVADIQGCGNVMSGINEEPFYSDPELVMEEYDKLIEKLRVPFSQKTSELKDSDSRLVNFAEYKRPMAAPFSLCSCEMLTRDELVANVKRYVSALQIQLPFNQFGRSKLGNIQIRDAGQTARIHSIPTLAQGLADELASGSAGYKGETRKVIIKRTIAELHRCAIFGKPLSPWLYSIVCRAVRDRAFKNEETVFARIELLMLFSLVRKYRRNAAVFQRPDFEENQLLEQWLEEKGESMQKEQPPVATSQNTISPFVAAGRAVRLYDHLHRAWHGRITGQSCKFLGGFHSNFLSTGLRLAKMGAYICNAIEQAKDSGRKIQYVYPEQIAEFQDMMSIVRKSNDVIRPNQHQSAEIDEGYYGKCAEMNARITAAVKAKKERENDEAA